ncbi:PepSY-associated TM helix domain-containing protein [Ideonella dechloratans]|uniref:PepSY-associated TM helix domain-containing protein n=1 Tax=Ideonella dechloratans TaxID=36863 RepID=UPI0035B14865
MSTGGFKTLLRWHWISSALCLIGMLVFAITGFTLNHAADIEAQPSLTRWQATLPAPVLAAVQAARPAQAGGSAPVPATLRQWATQTHGLRLPAGLAPEWSDEELYLAMPRPGGDAWLRVDLRAGEAEFEDSDRGVLALLNDLHKGRHTGAVWRAFLDVFAAGCLVFCITGLLILHRHAGQRALTWPLTAAGFVLPALLVLLFIH